jgi:hypothetical protein
MQNTTLTPEEFKRQNDFNIMLCDSLYNKTAQYKGVSRETGDTGLLEVKIKEKYACIYFYFDFDYKADNSGNILPEFTIEVTEVFDFDSEEITLKSGTLYSVAEDLIKDILDSEDLDTWASFGVDEERLYFEDDTPNLPITL